jgi:hypothetical protein
MILLHPIASAPRWRVFSTQYLGRCAGAVGPDVGVADALATGPLGRGLFESNPSGPAGSSVPALVTLGTVRRAFEIGTIIYSLV